MLSSLFRSTYYTVSGLFYSRFLRFARGGMTHAEQHLLHMLNDAKDTVYGKRYGFADIQNAADYAARVPLVTYDQLLPDIEAQLAGTPQMFTAEEPIYFAKSSGTTGSQKTIPMTKSSMRATSLSMMFLHQGSQERLLPKVRLPGRSLMMIGMGANGDESSGAATSGGMARMKNVMPLFWVTPAAALTVQDQNAAHYLHLLFALQERNLDTISAPFASSVLQLLKNLELHHTTLVQDIAHGTIAAHIIADDTVRSALRPHLKASPTRAMELQHLFAGGMTHIVPRVWPKLRSINTVISGDFAIYEPLLRHYTGGVAIFSSIYGASEGQIGIGMSLDTPTYMLCTDSTYFEFIPEEYLLETAPPVRRVDEVTVGARYELVVTTLSGFYRYRLGDVVEITSLYHGTPLVRYCYRAGILLNVSGEKTSTEALRDAISATAEASHTTVGEYTATINITDVMPYYHVFVATPTPLDATVLESALRQANPRYAAARSAGKIGPCRISPVALSAFEALKEARLAQGTSLNQFKMPRRISAEEAAQYFDDEEGIV